MDTEQNKPVLDGATEAGTDEKIDGLIEQLNHDWSGQGQSRDDLEGLARQRFSDAGIELDDKTLERIIERVSAP